MRVVLSKQLSIVSLVLLMTSCLNSYAGGLKRLGSAVSLSAVSFLAGMSAHPKVPQVATPESLSGPEPSNRVHIHLKDREQYHLDGRLVCIDYSPLIGYREQRVIQLEDKTSGRVFKSISPIEAMPFGFGVDQTITVKPESSWWWEGEDEEQEEVRYLIKSEHSSLFDCKQKNRDCWCQKDARDSQDNRGCWFKNHSRAFWQTISSTALSLKEYWSNKIHEKTAFETYCPQNDPEWLE